MGNGVLAQFEQLIQLALGDIAQPLLAVGLEVGDQVVQLRDVVPQVVEGFGQAAREGGALQGAAL
ncbi:hypothetical protein [Pseudomonas sp. 25 E 4]|nr:hypothetical protein [Pseudomonas sp. 25 E 4]CRM14512.1 hypothetical protein [Pseudomonas sp. 25 E 4]